MPNEIYHRSNWGESKAEDFGDVYYDYAATNKLYNHSDYYENSDGTDAILRDLSNKASIVLTPTAYSDGSLNTVIPPYQVLPTELVTNGDFSDGLNGWNFTAFNSAEIQNNKLKLNINDGTVNAAIDTTGTDVFGVNEYKVEFDYDFTNLNVSRFDIVIRSGNTIYYSENDSTRTQGKLTKYLNINNSGKLKINIVTYDSLSSYATIDNVSVKEIQEADFDFSRGSSATRVNEQGLVEDVQILSGELVQNGDFEEIGSELVTNGDFSDGTNSWITNGDSFTIVDGALRINRVTNTTFIQQNVLTSGKKYKVEFDVLDKDDNNGTFIVRLGSNNVYDVVTYEGTRFSKILTSSGTDFRIYSSSDNGVVYIDNVSVKEVGQNWTLGTGWSIGDGKLVGDGAESNALQSGVVQNGNSYKITITTSNITTGYLSVRVGSGGAENFQVNSNGTQTFYTTADNGTFILFRNQSSFDGSIDNVSVVEVTNDTDLPRIDFTDGTGSLLLEPQRTNLITYSEDFSSLNIRSNAIVTSNAIVSPSGLLDADEITFDGTYSGRVEQTVPVTIGQSYTISLYLKNKNLSDTTQVWIGFSVVAQGSYVTITDEWQRYDVTIIADGTSEYPRIQFSGTGSLYAWGFQVEEGSYATSYIPTSGSTVTRSADVANNSGNADLINSTEGVLYFEFQPNSTDTSSLSLSDGSSNNFLQIYIPYNTTNLRYRLSSNGISQFDRNLSTSTDLSLNNKYAFKWKLNDYSLWVNGSKLDTHLTGSTPIGMNSINFYSVFSNLQKVNGKVKCVAVFKEALTDEELQELTS